VRIRNWETFQHYKHRSPPWIRLYRTLLDNPEWFELPPAAAKLLVELWLMASEKDGELPDSGTLAWRLRRTRDDVEMCLKSLVDRDFVIPDVATLAPCLQDASKMLLQSRVEESRDREEKKPAGAHAELHSWMGEHAGCLAHLEGITQSAIWGLWGPSGVQAQDWKGIEPPRQQAILSTVVLTYAAEGKRGFHRPFFAKILTRAVEDAITSDRQAEQRDTEQSTASEHRTAAKRLEEAEIARLNAEAVKVAAPIPVGSRTHTRGTGLEKVVA
jgi:hypothetical protein